VVRAERRNHQNRADTLRRVLTWIQREHRPVACVPRYLANPDVGTRILKQLATRGLVRSTHEGWMPRPVLLKPAPLIEVDES
jgi:hypothetical protein